MFWKKKEVKNEKYIRLNPQFKEMREEIIKIAEYMATGKWDTISLSEDVGIFSCEKLCIRINAYCDTLTVGRGCTSYSIKEEAELTDYEKKYLKPFMEPFINHIKKEKEKEKEKKNDVLSEMFKFPTNPPKAKPKKKKE